MNKFWNSVVTSLFLVVLLSVTLVVPIQNVFAQGAGQGLEIGPPLLDLKANPGQTLTAQIRLRNVTTQPLVARAQYEDFVSSGEDGQPKLLLEGSGETSPYSIKSWLSTTPNMTLNAQEQKTITLTITVPADAAPGGHYGVVRFTGAPPEVDESAVSLSASIGTLVLINVSGDVREEAKFAELFSSQDGKKRNLFEYGPITITARIQNSGNIHIQPSGVIRVTNMFGKEVGSFQLNQNKGNVLPASIRKFEQKLDKKLLFGRYTVQADLVYGAEKNIINAKHTFWVVPYKLIAIGIISIALLIFFVRTYNRFILSRAGKRETNNGDSKKSK